MKRKAWYAPRVNATLSAPGPRRLAACRFFFHYELPKMGAWLQVVSTRDMTCADLPEAAF